MNIEGICGHCNHSMQGTAGIQKSGEDYVPLCHPDVGMDCYRLVTVYGHPLMHQPCMDVALTMNYPYWLMS